MSELAVRFAAGLEFHFFPGIGARADKQDPGVFAVNIHVVKALIEMQMTRI